MPFLPLQYILKSTSSPEQVNQFTKFYDLFNSDIGLHNKILNVEPLFFQGPIAGSEFLAYVITKLYLSITATFYGGVISLNVGQISFFNENNALTYQHVNDSLSFTAGNAVYLTNPIIISDFYFSRSATVNYTSMIFNGYRITLN